jgi:hypothetical protein
MQQEEHQTAERILEKEMQLEDILQLTGLSQAALERLQNH